MKKLILALELLFVAVVASFSIGGLFAIAIVYTFKFVSS